MFVGIDVAKARLDVAVLDVAVLSAHGATPPTVLPSFDNDAPASPPW
jgi:hypothetical protein